MPRPLVRHTDRLIYYYATDLWYEPGDAVQPGSWGRAVLGAGTAHDWFAREMLVEHMRQQEFPEKASRLTSLMVSDNLDQARRWLDNSRFHVYQLEAEATSTVVDVGWLNRATVNHLVQGASVAHSLAEAQQCIRSYWNGAVCPDGTPMEHIVPGAGRVVERVV
jgi:hypothetical protein